MAIMVSRHVRHLRVLKEGKLVGMVSIHDLLQLRLDEVQIVIATIVGRCRAYEPHDVRKWPRTHAAIAC